MKNLRKRYYLESNRTDKNRNKPELLMCEINYGFAVINNKGKKRYTPLRYSLQVNIQPSKFGLKENNYKYDENIVLSSSKNNATVRTKIYQFETALNEIATSFISKNIVPNPSELKVELNRKLRNEILKEPETTILTYIYSKIQKDTENSNKSKKNSIRESSIKVYKTVSHLIENYQIATNEALIFEQFDEKKYWDFWDILDDILKDKIKVENPNQPKKQRKSEHGYLVSTLRKYQKAFITTLKEARKDGYITSLDIFDTNLILEDSEAQKDFYIEESILKKIIDSEVAEPSLQSTKDYFVIASLTGMRFESMIHAQNTEIQLFKNNNYNFHYIHSIHNKTGTEVYIPLFKPVMEIIEKRGFPVIPSNSTLNARLKKLFRELKINHEEKVTKVTYRSGIIETSEPISELVSSHDCKGTFFSNLYTLNIPEHIISNITHPDRKPKNAMAKIYNKTTMLEKAKMFVDELDKVKSEVYKF